MIALGTIYLEDTLFNTSLYGSPDSLNILLEIYTVALEVVNSFNPKFDLLLNVCGIANINVVRFILYCYTSPEN